MSARDRGGAAQTRGPRAIVPALQRQRATTGPLAYRRSGAARRARPRQSSWCGVARGIDHGLVLTERARSDRRPAQMLIELLAHVAAVQIAIAIACSAHRQGQRIRIAYRPE